MKEATKVYQQSVARLSESDTDDDGEERNRDNVVKIPKVGVDNGYLQFEEVRHMYCFF